MSRNQRLGFLAVAVAIAVAAIVAFGAAGDGEEDAGPAAGTPAPQETAAPQEASPGEEARGEAGGERSETGEPTATPRPQPPLVTGDEVRTLTFEQGQTARFRVRSPEPEEIHVHGYNITQAVPAGRTVTVSFKATITGIFEVEFHNAGRPIAELKVQPR